MRVFFWGGGESEHSVPRVFLNTKAAFAEAD